METGGAQLSVSMSNTEKREILPEENYHFLSQNAKMRCDIKTGQQKETNFLVAPIQDLQVHHTSRSQRVGLGRLGRILSPLRRARQRPSDINQKFGLILLQTETQLSRSRGGTMFNEAEKILY